jgi:hypothetical protein
MMAFVPSPQPTPEQPPPEQAPSEQAPPEQAPSERTPPERPRPPAPDRGPVLPQRGSDETDAGWGERPEPDDDDRLRQERPPHYDQ